MKKTLILLTSFVLVSSVYAQKNFPWTDINESVLSSVLVEKTKSPQKYRTIRLKTADMSKILKNAPMRGQRDAKAKDVSLIFPMPDGTNQKFRIYEAPVMHPDLAAKYPEIKSFIGYGIDDPTANARFGISPSGFHAMIYSGKANTAFIDVISKGDTESYYSFYRKDFKSELEFHCHAGGDALNWTKQDVGMMKKSGDCALRNYRLALACTGEYAQFHGGTKNSVMDEYNRAIARVNSIYERDFSVTMTLVPNTDQLIFLNAGTDPYTNSNVGTMLGQNQTECDNTIGDGNYDIGHVFSTSSQGGIARIRSVCQSGRKARGVTGLAQPTGDPFWVEYVCHEMGHQFGANHTQNNPCARVNDTAVEPGSGSSIMSYAGICLPNVVSVGNADPFFHANSMIEIYGFIQGGADCAAKTPGGNIPTAEAAFESKTLPVSTPFRLYGTVDDPDGTDAMTYSWDQMDSEIAAMPPVSTNTGGPAFRYIAPDDTPERYFPNLDAIVNGQTPEWEVLPSVSRDMNFRFVARDNTPGNGCVGEDDVALTFNENAGPFLVEIPNGGEIWFVGETKKVEWDVANTGTAPVNCANVNIYLSKDGGYTYPVMLAENVPNIGEYDFMVPLEITDEARVMVSAADNYFLDISNQNFTLQLPPEPTFIINSQDEEISVCNDDVANFQLDIESLVGFNENVNLSVTGVPAGANAGFQPQSLTPTGSASLLVSNLSGVATGTYNLMVIGTSVTKADSVDLILNVFNGVPSQPVLAVPGDGEEQVTTDITLMWNDDISSTSYFVEVASNPQFGSSVIYSDSVDGNEFSLTGLPYATLYFWRVTPKNACGDGGVSEIFAFRTLSPVCEIFTATDLPVNIPTDRAGNYTAEIDIASGVEIVSSRVLVDFGHTYIGDLTARVTAPDGAFARLFDRPGLPAEEFGCDGNNIQAIFEDGALASSNDFENTCDAGSVAIMGSYRSIDPLSGFNGMNSTGTWTLNFSDNAAEDGGSLNNFQIEICRADIPPNVPNTVLNVPLSVKENTSENITSQHLEMTSTGNTAAEISYVLRRLPAEGDLLLNGSLLPVGSSFTQADIDSGLLSYLHTGAGIVTSDDFVFDVFNIQGGWLSGQAFNINILVNTLSVSTTVSNSIACFGDNNGEITVSVSGGTAPFEYRLNSGTYQSNNVFTQLIPGDYVPSVRDANGFLQSGTSVQITEPDEISASASVSGDDITVTASGGTGDLEYSTDGTDFQSSNIFEDMSNGAYTITIRDENDCRQTTSAIVAVNSLITSLEIIKTISCFGENDAQVQVNVAGGMSPYQYSLNGSAFQGSNIFEDLGAGDYTAMVRDAEGFTQASNLVTILEPDAIMSAVVVNADQITVNASGGTGTLRYDLDGAGFQTNNVFTGVVNGTHTVTVRDDNGCTDTESVDVAVNRVEITGEIIEDVLCFGINNGIIEAVASGGAEPYMYSINGSPFQATGRFEDLSSDCYTVTVRDAEGFERSTGSICLSQPQQIMVSTTVNGYDITVTASGGNPPFEYSIDGGGIWQQSNVFRNNEPGDYNPIFVRDMNGCVLSTAAKIDIDDLTLTGTLTGEIKCAGDATGEVTLTAEGGLSPFEYSENGSVFQNSNVFSGLTAGAYVFTVRDAGDVTATFDITIMEPARLTVNSPTYSDGDMTVTATGGIPPYEFNFNGTGFNTSSVLVNVTPGQTYQVQCRDANDCISIGNFTVPRVSFDETSITHDCTGAQGASVQISTSGGVEPLEYSLDSVTYQNDNTFLNVSPGTYSVYIRDAGGFEYQFSAGTVSAYPMALDVSVIDNDAVATAMGGATPYEYSLNGVGFSSENEFMNLDTGRYTLVVRDANGCDASSDFVVNTSGINDLNFDLNFEIHPNPSAGLLKLKVLQPVENQLYVRIFDIAGKLVLNEEIENAGGQFETIFDVYDLKAGTYLMVVSDGRMVGREQIVIMK